MDSDSSKDGSFTMKTALVGILCCVGAGAGSYLLYLDFNQSGGVGQGSPMAKVERREAKVRRKAASSFAWTHVQPEESLFRRDSVQTSVGSAAAIRFNDGTVLELGENSLVVIDDINKLSLDFMKGTVVLHMAEGDKRVTVDKDGKAQLEEIAIRLVQPEPLVRYFTRDREAKQIHFAWKSRDAKPGQSSSLPPEYTLQISSDKNFKSARVQNIAIKNGAVPEIDASLPAGAYFWRLADGVKPLTEIGQFRVVAASPLKPVWPATGEKILRYGDAAPLQLRWVGQGDGVTAAQVSHSVQVARDPEFKNLVATQDIAATSGLATLKDLPESQLYWRIQSHYADLVVESAPERFTITQAVRPALVQTFPSDKKTLELKPQLALTWTSDADGLEYLAELQTAQGKEVASGRSSSLAFAWTKPEAGAYRWRVSAFHKEHSVGETPWRVFTVFEGGKIALKTPSRDQELFYWEKPTPFSFTWDHDILADRHPEYSYQVQASTEGEFKAPVIGPKSRETALPAEALKLPPGQYYWRVSVVDASGQVIKSSEAWKFAHGTFPPLSSPLGVTPAPSAVFNVVEQEKNPVLTWNEVPGAEAYEVTLYAQPPTVAGRTTAAAKAPRIISQTVVTSTTREIKNLKPAAYTWTVRAIDRIKRKGEPMPLRPFTVTYGEVLTAPEATSAEVQ
jgi:hypothetical protein